MGSEHETQFHQSLSVSVCVWWESKWLLMILEALHELETTVPWACGADAAALNRRSVCCFWEGGGRPCGREPGGSLRAFTERLPGAALRPEAWKPDCSPSSGSWDVALEPHRPAFESRLCCLPAANLRK